MIGQEYIEFSKKNIIEYFKLILEKKYNKELVLKLLDTYIKVRYYNYYETKSRNAETNINYYMKQIVMEDKENEELKQIFYIFKYILYFDNVKPYDDLKKIVKEINEYKINALKLENETFENELIKLVKENEKRKQKYLSSFSNEHFQIELKNTNKRKVAQVKLNYDIKFNKIYSAYSINKVYNSPIINEQKAFITYYLTSLEILKNAIDTTYDKEYIVDFPIEILEKKQKTQRLKEVINNELIKNNIILKVDYKDYLSNRDTINEWIKEGYNFAPLIDASYNYEENSRLWLDIFKYIIVDKEKINFFDSEKAIVK